MTDNCIMYLNSGCSKYAKTHFGRVTFSIKMQIILTKNEGH